MGWVDDLAGQTIGLDTAPLIYFIEEHSVYMPIIERFFIAMANETIATLLELFRKCFGM